MAKVSKGELHARLYTDCSKLLKAQYLRHDFDDAITTAVASFEHIPPALTFLSRGGVEVPRLETIDFLISNSPLLLHQKSLFELAEFLKRNRTIPKKLPHDVLAELEQSYLQLQNAYQVWNLLLTKSPISHDQLRGELGEPIDRWDSVISSWHKWELLLCNKQGGTKTWTLVGADSHKVRGKCPNCGVTGTGGLYKLLQEFSCPKCKSNSGYRIVGL